MNAMYSVEQVNVPPELGTIMKQLTKAILRDQPENVYKYSANFFAILSGRSAPFDQDGQLTEGIGGPAALAKETKEHLGAPAPAAAAPQHCNADEDQKEAAADSVFEPFENPEGEDEQWEQEGAAVTDEDVVLTVFQKYNVGEEGTTTVELLPALLADLREALELSEDDLPPAEEVIALLNCEDGLVDLLELKQLFFEGEDV